MSALYPDGESLEDDEGLQLPPRNQWEGPGSEEGAAGHDVVTLITLLKFSWGQRMAIMWQCALCRLTAGLPSAQSLPGQAVVAVAWQCKPRPPGYCFTSEY